MYDFLLNKYKDDEYVYIIDGCTDIYVSKEPCKYQKCPLCGDRAWPIVEGKVSDIKSIKTYEELQEYEKKRILSKGKKM